MAVVAPAPGPHEKFSFDTVFDATGADEVAQRFDAMINQPPDVVDAMGKYIKLGE